MLAASQGVREEMEDNTYWRSRASQMRERASHIRDPFVSGGFIALAEQYDLLAEDGARWIQGGGPLHLNAHIEALPKDLPQHKNALIRHA
jgi:hypothetical protein